MGIVQALFSAQGRMRRRDYWLWSILATLVFVALEYTAFKILGTGSTFAAEMRMAKDGYIDNFSYAYFALILLMQWPMICLNAKRWHDRGRPAIIAVLLAFAWIGYLGVRYAKAHIILPYIEPIWGACNVIYYSASIWAFVECGCLDGTKGRNPYGPSPKGLDEEANVF